MLRIVLLMLLGLNTRFTSGFLPTNLPTQRSSHQRNSALHFSTNPAGSMTSRLTASLQRKMNEWTEELERNNEDRIGSLLRDVVMDSVQQCMQHIATAPVEPVPPSTQRTFLELELRRSNQRLYKSLEEHLRESEMDLARLQAGGSMLAKSSQEPIGRFE